MFWYRSGQALEKYEYQQEIPPWTLDCSHLPSGHVWRDLTFCSVFVNIYKTNTQEGVVVLCALRLFQLAFVSMHGRTCWRFSDVGAFLFDPSSWSHGLELANWKPAMP